MNRKQAIKGLAILAGELLPEGWVFTSDDGQDREQEEQMVKWLNEIETNPRLTHCAGGTYYVYAIKIAKYLYEYLKNE